MGLKLLYLIRHSKAHGSHPDGDENRSLSPEGLQRLDLLLPELKRRDFRADLVLCSPYRRAVQTKDRMGSLLDGTRVELSSSFTPEAGLESAVAELVRWEAQGFERIALVTHNPFVSLLAERLLAPLSVSDLEFRTPTILALEFEQRLQPFRARPLWIIHP